MATVICAIGASYWSEIYKHSTISAFYDTPHCWLHLPYKVLAAIVTLLCNHKHALRGNYQEMEFLGDACLQLIASHYIFYGFPGHNEGHLTVRECVVVVIMVVMETTS